MQVKRIFFQKPQRIRFGQSIERWNNKKKSAKTNTILMLIPNKCPRRIEFNYFSHRSWEDVDYKWRTLSLVCFKQHLMAFFTTEWTCSEGWCQIPKFVAFPLIDAIVLNFCQSQAKNINLTPVGAPTCGTKWRADSSAITMRPTHKSEKPRWHRPPEKQIESVIYRF